MTMLAFLWRIGLRPCVLLPITAAFCISAQAAGFKKLETGSHGLPAQLTAISADRALQLLPGLCIDASVRSGMPRWLASQCYSQLCELALAC